MLIVFIEKCIKVRKAEDRHILTRNIFIRMERLWHWGLCIICSTSSKSSCHLNDIWNISVCYLFKPRDTKTMCLEKSETEYFPSSRKKLNVRIHFCHHKNLAFPIEQQHAASPDFVTSVASTGRFLFFQKGNWIKIMTNAGHSHFVCMKSLKGSFSEIKRFGR